MPENESSHPLAMLRPDISPSAAVPIQTEVDNPLPGVEISTNNTPEVPHDPKDDAHGGYKNEGSNWSIDTTPKAVPTPESPLATAIPRPETPSTPPVDTIAPAPPDSTPAPAIEVAPPNSESQGLFSTITTATDTGEAVPDTATPTPELSSPIATPDAPITEPQAPAEIIPIRRTMDTQATTETPHENSSANVIEFKRDVNERIINFNQKKLEIEAKRKQIDADAAAQKQALTKEEEEIDADKAILESIMNADDALVENIINHTRRETDKVA